MVARLSKREALERILHEPIDWDNPVEVGACGDIFPSQAGGSCILSGTAGASYADQLLFSSQKIIGIRTDGPPRQLCVQVQSVILVPSAAASSNQKVVAECIWSCGRGQMRATADVGCGTSFTISACQGMDVTIRLESADLVDTTLVPGDTVQVNAVCGFSTSPQPRAARITNTIDLTGGAVSSIFRVPTFARNVTAISETAINSPSTELRFLSTNNAATRKASVSGGGVYPVPNGIDYYQVFSPYSGLVTLIWELSL